MAWRKNFTTILSYRRSGRLSTPCPDQGLPFGVGFFGLRDRARSHRDDRDRAESHRAEKHRAGLM